VNSPLSEEMRSRLLAVRLPSPPQTLLRLLALCQSDDVGMAELAELIAQDPAMTAKVLSVAHSAAFHRADAQRLSLLQASSRLGTSLIKVLVISESVFQTFNAFKQAGNVDLRFFWQHSLHVALIARELAVRLEDASPEDAYLVGLLHDVGRLALLAATPGQDPAIWTAPDDEALCALEQQRQGIHHADAGAWLLDQWHLSEALVQSVQQHHVSRAQATEAAPLTRILHLAHRLANLASDEVDEAVQIDDEPGLASVSLISIAQKASHQVTQIAHHLGIDVAAPEARPARPAPVAAAPVDPVQTQLVQDALERSVLNEMTMTLIGQSSTESALNLLRQYASALLHLEDAQILLLSDNPAVLVAVSLSERRRSLAEPYFPLSEHAPLADCVSQRKVVFVKRGDEPADAMLDALATDELVLLPLLTARQCLGVLVAIVPAALSQHLRTQASGLQMFGVYAGLALSRRPLADLYHEVHKVLERRQQQREFDKLARQIGQLFDALAAQAQTVVAVDLCRAIREIMQVLQTDRLIPHRIVASSQLAERATPVMGSMAMIQQIVLILVKEACQSMPDGGQIVVDGGVLVKRGGAMFTALSISDTGTGQVEDVQARLFEYLPNKDGGDRPKPGLNVVSHLVDKMAGFLKFTSSPSGKRFDILLPCARSSDLSR